MEFTKEDTFQNKLISNSIFHLLNFERYDNFQIALREAAIANNFQAVIVSQDFNPVFSVETRKKTTIEEAVEAWRNNANNRESAYKVKDINGVLTYWGPINIAGEKNFLMLVDNDDSYTGEEISKLAEIIEIAIVMWKYTVKKDTRAELIKALRRGNRSLVYTLNKEVNVDEEKIISVFYAKGISEKDIDISIQNTSRTENDIMRINEGMETYGIIFSKTKREIKHREEERATCIEFYSSLNEYKDCSVFHVTGITGIEGAIDGYQLINETGHFAETIYPSKRNFSKYELSLVRNCVGIEIQGGGTRKTFLDMLEPFKEVGKTKEKQFLDTLETFVLDTDLSNNKTAEIMGIHANTVQYRIKRIEELLGTEITVNEIVPSMAIALALRRLSKS